MDWATKLGSIIRSGQTLYHHQDPIHLLHPMIGSYNQVIRKWVIACGEVNKWMDG